MGNLSSRITLLVALAFCAAVAFAESTKELAIASDPAIVDIETREGTREFIQLPALKFDLDISQQCQAERVPVTLSISVADTRRTISASELASSEILMMPLSVPAAQIAPVAIAGFCVSGNDEQDSVNDESLRIGDVLSLQASLLCESESSTQIHYASTALDVELRCNTTSTDTAQTTEL